MKEKNTHTVIMLCVIVLYSEMKIIMASTVTVALPYTCSFKNNPENLEKMDPDFFGWLVL